MFIFASCSLKKPFKNKIYSLSNPPIELIHYQISLNKIKNLDQNLSNIYLSALSQTLDKVGISNYIFTKGNKTQELELICVVSLKKDLLFFFWKLIDKENKIITNFTTKEPITIFQTLDPLALERATIRVAIKIKDEIYLPSNPSVFISKLEGFPNGRGSILAKFLKEELTKLNIDVYLNEPMLNSNWLTLSAELNRKIDKKEKEKIIITWFLNGKKTDFIQENTIPIKTLDKAWVSISHKISENAAPFIAKEIKSSFQRLQELNK